MIDILEQDALEKKQQWNKKFLDDPSTKRIEFYPNKYFYCQTNGDRIINIYTIDEFNRIHLESIGVLSLHPFSKLNDNGSITFRGQVYSKKEIQESDENAIRFENL